MEPLFRTFTLGSTIELQVNISDFQYDSSYIRTLAWFHNGTSIYSNTNRTSVLNNGKTIIIRDATHRDAGSYKVEVSSLKISGQDSSVCSLWLPMLRNHARYAPVIFTIKLINEPSSTQCK